MCGFVDKLKGQKDPHHSISLTGGEPLLQVDVLKILIPKLKERGSKIYLETNGTMPERLAEIIGQIDIIAMDLKLPSMTGASDMLAEHKKFLEIAIAQDMFVKIVFGRESKPVEIENASKAIASIDKDIPLVLQPVTPVRDIKHGPLPEQIVAFHSIAKRNLTSVRVIPQVHKMLGIL